MWFYRNLNQNVNASNRKLYRQVHIKHIFVGGHLVSLQQSNELTIG